jgi:hypothetical protein
VCAFILCCMCVCMHLYVCACMFTSVTHVHARLLITVQVLDKYDALIIILRQFPRPEIARLQAVV